ncbi:unnamed protein product [Lupinus luteus]|uniref:Uncharacterized protein n=1 Tax=Lupinus luteus TaxID=3873 RepID=A0AAV1XAQ9_LUPLU
MLNERENVALLVLLLIFSTLLSCICLTLVIKFIMEFIGVMNSSPKDHEALWAGIGIVVFTIYAFAFISFVIFPSCAMLFKSGSKIAPTPISVEVEQHQSVVIQQLDQSL